MEQIQKLYQDRKEKGEEWWNLQGRHILAALEKEQQRKIKKLEPKTKKR